MQCIPLEVKLSCHSQVFVDESVFLVKEREQSYIRIFIHFLTLYEYKLCLPGDVMLILQLAMVRYLFRATIVLIQKQYTKLTLLDHKGVNDSIQM